MAATRSDLGTGPGFNRRVRSELKRIDPRLDLVWCQKRLCWCVVREAPSYDQCWWSGMHRPGWTMLVRWLGVDGEYDATALPGEAEALPLDDRLLELVRRASPRSWAHENEPLEEIERRESEEGAAATWARLRSQIKRDVRRRMEPYYTDRTLIVPGVAPGLTRYGGPRSGGGAGTRR